MLLLLERHDININIQNKAGETPLGIACHLLERSLPGYQPGNPNDLLMQHDLTFADDLIDELLNKFKLLLHKGKLLLLLSYKQHPLFVWLIWMMIMMNSNVPIIDCILTFTLHATGADPNVLVQVQFSDNSHPVVCTPLAFCVR